MLPDKRLSALGGWMIDFISNDFLGFARCPILLDLVNKQYAQYCLNSHIRLGSTGSRVILGESQLLCDLERKITEYHQVEAALLVHSGYMANFGLCAHLAKHADVILYDEAVHVSITHSLAYVTTKAIAFRHNDMGHCETLLKELCSQEKRVFVLVSSIYSFQGTRAPLKELLNLTQRYHAHLIVDEAHAMGILGEAGRGVCYDLGYHHFYAVLVTYGKAMGTMGAAILTTASTKALLYKEPALSYSTAMAPFIMLSISSAYDFLGLVGEERRQQLYALQEYFNRCCAAVFDQNGPIYLSLSKEQEARQMFHDAGLDVGIILQDKKALLRVNIHSYNSKSEIDCLVSVLEEMARNHCLSSPEMKRMSVSV